ncbi:MAG TPA: hypothetical protein VF331_13065 [Polyangiales bacterium]
MNASLCGSADWRCVAWACAWLCAAACGDDTLTERSPQAATPAPPQTAPEPSVDWAAHVVDTPEEPPPSAAASEQTQAATLADHDYEAGAEVPVRHLVYRVGFVVPPELRGGRPLLSAPAGELHIDVSRERLRARLVGPGWPCDEGTEVRLRSDVPGVYLFDGQGGRPLPPGQLAAWFQGHEGGHTKGGVRVLRESGKAGGGPGELVCALLAEWTRQDRDDVLPRCVGGSLAPGFRFGLWSAELTAIVPLSLPRTKLRADAGDPPAPISALPYRAILEPSELSRLVPSHVRTADPRFAPVDASVTDAALDVDNDSDARVIVIAQGVPVGWVRAHAHGHFPGFTPGYYYIGAVRPFGQPAMRAGLIRVPSSLHLRKPN